MLIYGSSLQMRVCWQTSQTVFSGNQLSSLGDATGKEIPDFRFDPASTSAVSITALRYSIEVRTRRYSCNASLIRVTDS